MVDCALRTGARCFALRSAGRAHVARYAVGRWLPTRGLAAGGCSLLRFSFPCAGATGERAWGWGPRGKYLPAPASAWGKFFRWKSGRLRKRAEKAMGWHGIMMRQILLFLLLIGQVSWCHLYVEVRGSAFWLLIGGLFFRCFPAIGPS